MLLNNSFKKRGNGKLKRLFFGGKNKMGCVGVLVKIEILNASFYFRRLVFGF